MSELHVGDEVRVRIQSSADIVTARQEGRSMAATLGFTNTTLTHHRHRDLRGRPQHRRVREGRRDRHRAGRQRHGARACRSSRAIRARASSISRRRCATAIRRARVSGMGLPGAKRLMDRVRDHIGHRRRHDHHDEEVDRVSRAHLLGCRRGADDGGDRVGRFPCGEAVARGRAGRGDRRRRARQRGGRRRADCRRHADLVAA